MSKELDLIYQNWICDPDIYKYAYENCKEFRLFINNLPESTMKKIKKVHAMQTAANVAHGYRKGVLHLCTGGISLIAEKAFFKSKKQRVAEIVDSEEFAKTFRNLYMSGVIYE